MTMRSAATGLIFAAFVLLAGGARAELENENLLAPLPDGYKIDFHNRKGNELISEMVPKGENVNNWTEMVTVQVFFGMKGTPEQFKNRMVQLWSDACPGSSARTLSQDPAGGYPSMIWAMTCPRN